MRRAVAVLDCGRKAVTVTSTGGVHEGTWSGAYSRKKAIDLIAKSGWREAPGEDPELWTVAPAENGFQIAVIHDPVSVAVRQGFRR